MLEWWIPYILFCEVREIERNHSPSLMIKIPSVEALYYSTFQNRKDELLLQWHRSNLKVESIALPMLNTKDVHCLQTEFFLVRAKLMIRFFFYFFFLQRNPCSEKTAADSVVPILVCRKASSFTVWFLHNSCMTTACQCFEKATADVIMQLLMLVNLCWFFIFPWENKFAFVILLSWGSPCYI